MKIQSFGYADALLLLAFRNHRPVSKFKENSGSQFIIFNRNNPLIRTSMIKTKRRKFMKLGVYLSLALLETHKIIEIIINT